jgi:hypothetical protein
VHGGRVIEASDNSIARLVFGDVWSLDLASKQWTLLSAGTDKGGPPPRFLHASAMVNATTLAVFGGLTFYGSSLFALDDVWLFELPTRTWRQHKMEVPLLRSALPMALSTIGAPPPDAADSADPAALMQVPALCAFGGYVIYTNAGLAVVYNDLLVWNLEKGYWEKFASDRSLPAPRPRFDHRGVLWKGTTLVFYGGSYQSVNDVGDVWMLDTSAIEPAQLVKAPAEGINALFYGRLLFIFASLLTLCFFSLCFSLRMRMNIMQRARLAEQQQQQQQQLAGGGMAGPNGQMDALSRAERERQAEEALRLLPVIPYQRPGPSHSRHSGVGMGGDGGATAAGADGALRLEEGGLEAEEEEEEDRGDDTCAICLSTYEPRDPLRCLPCGHRFHRACCDQWLRTSLTCPLCKTCASPHVADAAARAASLSSASDAGLLPHGPSSSSSVQQQQQQQQQTPRVLSLFSALNPFRSPSGSGGLGGGNGAGTGGSAVTTSTAASANGNGAGVDASNSSGPAPPPPQTSITFFPVPPPAPASGSGGPASGPPTAAVTGGGRSAVGLAVGMEEGVLNTPYTEMEDMVAASSSSSSPPLPPPPPPSQQQPFAATVAAAPATASPVRIGAAALEMEGGRAAVGVERRDGGGDDGAPGDGDGSGSSTVSLV